MYCTVGAKKKNVMANALCIAIDRTRPAMLAEDNKFVFL